MFTVIIAEENVFELANQFKSFLNPLITENITFCKWNPQGETLVDMLPDLYNLIDKKEEWRAVVVYNDGLERRNPYDYTGYKAPEIRRNPTQAELHKSLSDSFSAFDKALENPLTKLASALCGAPVADSYEENALLFEAVESGRIGIFEYMLNNQLMSCDCVAKASELKNYFSDQLSAFTSEKLSSEALLGMIADRNSKGICGEVPEKNLKDLISLLCNDDPMFSDPEYTVCKLRNTKKTIIFNSLKDGFTLLDKKPFEVICVAPRTFDNDYVLRNEAWNDNDEIRYSRFTEFNLYPQKLRYTVFDLLPKDDARYLSDNIRMLSYILVLAGNPPPGGSMEGNRVYRAVIDMDTDVIASFCEDYIDKLTSTVHKIQKCDFDLVESKKGTLNNKTAEYLFESKVNVPVEISSEFDRSKLYSKEKIGLSSDCPINEFDVWKENYRSIKKLFIRYLREPRRSIKKAASQDFHIDNKIEDERALLLNEAQIENVNFFMLDEEQAMVETKTIPIFNTEKFNKEMSYADKAIKKEMSRRMTKKKTLIIGGLSLAAYLFGFLPLLFGNLNTARSFVFSFIVTAVCVAMLSICGYICLVFFRKKLRGKFKGFNLTMYDIVSQIDDSLASYSTYLSHACNFMRGASVLEYPQKEFLRKRNILRKHRDDVENKIEEVLNTFSAFIEVDFSVNGESEPFDYDYTILADYDYDLLYPEMNTHIEYISKGYDLTLPVDYIERIIMIREELYD